MKAMKRNTVAVTIALGAAMLSLAAQAEEITVYLQAEVISVKGDEFEALVKVGDIVSGTYTYETNLPDNDPSRGLGFYVDTSAGHGFDLVINGMEFRTSWTTPLLKIFVENDSWGFDQLAIYSYNNHLPSAHNLIRWNMRGDQFTLQSDDIPATIPEPANLLYSNLLIHSSDTPEFQISATVTFAAVGPPVQ